MNQTLKVSVEKYEMEGYRTEIKSQIQSAIAVAQSEGKLDKDIYNS